MELWSANHLPASPVWPHISCDDESFAPWLQVFYLAGSSEAQRRSDLKIISSSPAYIGTQNSSTLSRFSKTYSLFASHVWECVLESVNPCASPTSITHHLLCTSVTDLKERVQLNLAVGNQQVRETNIHPVWVPSREVTELGVRVMSTGFDAMAGSVCSVVTDVFCYNGTHKATVLGKD